MEKSIILLKNQSVITWLKMDGFSKNLCLKSSIDSHVTSQGCGEVVSMNNTSGKLFKQKLSGILLSKSVISESRKSKFCHMDKMTKKWLIFCFRQHFGSF